MMTQREFVSQVEAFLKQSGMSARRLGVEVGNDAAMVYKLRRGRQTTLDMAASIFNFMQQHKDKGHDGTGRRGQRAAGGNRG